MMCNAMILFMFIFRIKVGHLECKTIKGGDIDFIDTWDAESAELLLGIRPGAGGKVRL